MARAVGATGTPTFVIGDQVLQGAVGYEALKAAVAEARARRS
jgi:protein-disulfide isomerase